MVFFEWLKEWAGALTLVSTIVIAIVLTRTERRHRKAQRMLEETNMITTWVKNVRDLISEYNAALDDEALGRVKVKMSGLNNDALGLIDIAARYGVDMQWRKVFSKLNEFENAFMPISSTADRARMPPNLTNELDEVALDLIVALLFMKGRI